MRPNFVFLVEPLDHVVDFPIRVLVRKISGGLLSPNESVAPRRVVHENH